MNITLCLSVLHLCLVGAVFAQAENVIVPGRGTTYQSKVILIGPKDSLTAARAISGKVRVMAVFPSTVKASEVEFSMDGKSIGKSVSKPFRVDLDTSSVALGEHILKAAAKDASGAEAWSASTRARVDPSSGPVSSTFGNVEVVPVPADSSPSDGSTKPADKASDAPPAVDRVYTSQTYGFSVSYPSSWAVKDDTVAASKRQSCAFWIIFGVEPIVVNVHARNLAPGTDPDKFAKYNPYVQSWTRKTTAGKPAFSTTSGSPDSHSVTHRLITLDQGRALMLNCVDKSGRPADESARLFDAIAQSLRTFVPPAHVDKKPK